MDRVNKTTAAPPGPNPSSFLFSLPRSPLSAVWRSRVRGSTRRRRPATVTVARDDDDAQRRCPALPFSPPPFSSSPSAGADRSEKTARWSPLSPVAHPSLRWVRRRRAKKPVSLCSLPPEGGAPSSDASACRCASDREGMGRPCSGPLCRRARGSLR